MAKAKPRKTRPSEDFQRPEDVETTPEQETSYQYLLTDVIDEIERRGNLTREQVMAVIEDVIADPDFTVDNIGARNQARFARDLIERLDALRTAQIKRLQDNEVPEEKIMVDRQENQRIRYLRDMLAQGVDKVKKPARGEKMKRKAYNAARKEAEPQEEAAYVTVYLQEFWQNGPDAIEKPDSDEPTKQKAYDEAKFRYENYFVRYYVEWYRQAFLNTDTPFPERPKRKQKLYRKAYDRALNSFPAQIEAAYLNKYYEEFKDEGTSDPARPKGNKILQKAYDKAKKRHENEQIDDFRLGYDLRFDMGEDPERPPKSEPLKRKAYDQAKKAFVAERPDAPIAEPPWWRPFKRNKWKKAQQPPSSQPTSSGAQSGTPSQPPDSATQVSPGAQPPPDSGQPPVSAPARPQRRHRETGIPWHKKLWRARRRGQASATQVSPGAQPPPDSGQPAPDSQQPVAAQSAPGSGDEPLTVPMKKIPIIGGVIDWFKNWNQRRKVKAQQRRTRRTLRNLPPQS